MKTVVITGALGGIGSVLCRIFAENNYKVIGVDKKTSGNFNQKLINYDISTIPSDKKAFADFTEEILYESDGKIDCVVNNAALQIVKGIEELDWNDWEMTFQTNLFAPAFIVKAFLPQLRAAKGTVINISSIHASLTKKNFTAYSTSKGALVSLTRAMALDLAPDIRVNAVIPAATDTPMLREGFIGNDNGFALLGHYHPMDRIGKPEEIAEAVVFLASEKASFMTGTCIWVDGGIGGVLSDPVYAR